MASRNEEIIHLIGHAINCSEQSKEQLEAARVIPYPVTRAEKLREAIAKNRETITDLVKVKILYSRSFSITIGYTAGNRNP